PNSSTEDSGSFPRDGTDAEIWEYVLRYAIRAPSGHNTQPWRFAISDDLLHLYADRSRRLPVVDPKDRALVISCGAALAHLTVALRHFGYADDPAPFPDPADPDLLATVGLGKARTPEPGDHELFEAISTRHTHRAAFETRPVPQQILAQLERDTQGSGAAVHVFIGDEPQAVLATLVAEGDRTQFSDAGFRRELAAWVRPNHTRRPDGVPGYALGISDLPSMLGPTMITTFDTGAKQAKKDEQLALTAPALIVLSTTGDTPSDWLAAGRAITVLLLRATAHGLAASFLNQPIEVPALRVRLRDLLGSSDSPQLLLRLGYGTNDGPTVRPTPRRAGADVLADSPTDTGTTS
ncbi:MAG: Acg family FMN-binding oxidoreductase, partial [Nocardioides sp.]